MRKIRRSQQKSRRSDCFSHIWTITRHISSPHTCSNNSAKMIRSEACRNLNQHFQSSRLRSRAILCPQRNISWWVWNDLLILLVLRCVHKLVLRIECFRCHHLHHYPRQRRIIHQARFTTKKWRRKKQKRYAHRRHLHRVHQHHCPHRPPQ